MATHSKEILCVLLFVVERKHLNPASISVPHHLWKEMVAATKQLAALLFPFLGRESEEDGWAPRERLASKAWGVTLGGCLGLGAGQQ